MIAVANRLQHIGEYYFSQKLREIETLRHQGADIINLGIGSPDLPPHPDVIAVLQQESSQPHQHAYQSYKGVAALRNAIAQWYHTTYGVVANPNTEVLPLIGSKEGIVHVCMTYLNPGDIALVPNPGYPTYGAAVQLAGATVDYYDILTVNDGQPNIEAIEKQLQAHGGKVKICFANTPHMPTGTTLQPKVAAALVALCKQYHVLLVHDNPYSCILNHQPESLLRYDTDKVAVIELNSLSKSHNMAGWRIGMVVAHETHINNILRFKSNMDSGMFLPIQLAAAKALSLGASWQQSLHEVYERRQCIAQDIFDALQVQYKKQQVGMFLWGQVPTSYESAYAMSDALLYDKHVFITPGGIFGSNGNNHIRISLCSNETILNQALERIKA